MGKRNIIITWRSGAASENRKFFGPLRHPFSLRSHSNEFKMKFLSPFRLSLLSYAYEILISFMLMFDLSLFNLLGLPRREAYYVSLRSDNWQALSIWTFSLSALSAALGCEVLERRNRWRGNHLPFYADFFSPLSFVSLAPCDGLATVELVQITKVRGAYTTALACK
jgi:hypothetical protein